MKKLILLVALCLALCPGCLAEAAPAGDFFSDLSDAWGSLVSAAQDAGKGVSDWMEDSGVGDWARKAATDVGDWLDQSGITQWVAGAAADIQSFIDKNRPAVEEWINTAGDNVKQAWDTIVNPNGHTEKEIQQAYQTLADSIGAPILWPTTETPVKLRYDRLWEYSASAKSEDPAVISALTDAIKALTVGERTDVYVEDYTDILTFTFADGRRLRLEFEGDAWVGPERYQVQGLDNVRALLDKLVEAQ